MKTLVQSLIGAERVGPRRRRSAATAEDGRTDGSCCCCFGDPRERRAALPTGSRGTRERGGVGSRLSQTGEEPQKRKQPSSSACRVQAGAEDRQAGHACRRRGVSGKNTLQSFALAKDVPRPSSTSLPGAGVLVLSRRTAALCLVVCRDDIVE